MNDEQIAQVILNTMDLTSLNKDDSSFKIEEVAKRAKTIHGDVASVCVYPQFIKTVKENTDVNVATVINYPHGLDEPSKIASDIKDFTKFGASEVDVVFPYRYFLDKEYKKVDAFLSVISSIDKDITSKVIIETSELEKLSNIVDVTKICLSAGANFIKTSTGKTKCGATPEAANIILETIATHPKKAGFKASGGIKTFEDARKYVVLADAIMGTKRLNKKNFRIGASSLLGDVLRCLSKT